MVQATAVTRDGRTSPDDSGIRADELARAFRRVTAFIAGQGAVPGGRLAHGGRKESVDAPWRGSRPLERAQRG